MAANSSIVLSTLDFDTIKDNLKAYLKSQTQFADYDYEGSNMNVLLDVLAYNTFQNAFYLNMAASESFLDSAQLRNSIISHAKELNYVPRSSRSAKATLTLAFTSNANFVTIPKGTSFTSTVGFNLYTFITDEDSIHFSSNGSFVIPDVDVYEGQLSSDQFIVDYANPIQRFLLTDPKIDTDSITVRVTEDDTGTVLDYSPASTTLGLGSGSLIYFLQAAEDGKYEVVFGDGILGRRPKDGATVTVDYRTCNQAEGNGATKFSLDSGFASFASTPTITVQATAIGGDVPESIPSIKYYAPRFFQTQERAVNVNDYEIILQQRFPEINAISAYGGEDLDPPQFGKVFISIDIADVEGLPTTKVNEYSNFIKARSPLSIDAVFVEPDHLYYAVTSLVKFNVNETSYNSEQIESLVADAIMTYNDSFLDDFKASFKYSKFIAQIDGIDNAGIVSNDTDVRIYKKVAPDFETPVNLDVSFAVPLTTAGGSLGTTYDAADLTAVTSSAFTTGGVRVQIQDDGAGGLRLVKASGSQFVVVNKGIGTIDYSTGLLHMNNLQIDGLDPGENELRIYGIPASRDFETSQNVILTLESSQLVITVQTVREGTSATQTRQRA